MYIKGLHFNIIEYVYSFILWITEGFYKENYFFLKKMNIFMLNGSYVYF